MESATTPEPTASEDEQTEPELSAGSSAPAPVRHINILVEGNTATFGTLWDLEDHDTTMSLADIRQLMATSFAETIAEWFDDGFRFVRKTNSGISPVRRPLQDFYLRWEFYSLQRHSTRCFGN